MSDTHQSAVKTADIFLSICKTGQKSESLFAKDMPNGAGGGEQRESSRLNCLSSMYCTSQPGEEGISLRQRQLVPYV